jgi:hypothetical protein
MIIQTFVLIDRLDVKLNFSWTNKAIGINVELNQHQFLVGAASIRLSSSQASREKIHSIAIYGHNRMIVAGSRSHNQNRINYNN